MKTRYKLLSILLLLAGIFSTAKAADRFYVEPILLEAGTSTTLDFLLDNQAAVYGFQAEVKLPDGILMKSVFFDNSRVDNSYNLITNTEDDKLLLVAYSDTHSPIRLNSGAVLKMQVEVTNDFTGGYLDISNIVAVNSSNQGVALPDCNTYIGLYIPVASVSLSPSEMSLKLGETASPTVTITPANATDKTLTWTTSNRAFADVDADGKITANNFGTAIITATSVNGKSASCTVNVVPTPVEEVVLNQTSVELRVGETFSLSATVVPADATEKLVI